MIPLTELAVLQREFDEERRATTLNMQELEERIAYLEARVEALADWLVAFE